MANSGTLIKDDNAHSLPLLGLGNDPIIITSTDTSVASAVIDPNRSSIVRLFASADCNIKAGTNPTASATTMKIPGGQMLDFVVLAMHKIAVLGATLQITKHNG